MITLAIQLVFQNKAKMTHQEVTNYLIEHLPEGEIVLASGPTEEGEVRLKLDQDTLTDEQRDFLHLDEIAEQYIDTFEVLPGKPLTIEQIKQRIQQLRAIRRKDIMYVMYPNLYPNSETAQAEKQLRDDLHPLGLTMFWCSDRQDYAIFNNEESV